jgi:hypothetical protein
LFDVVVGARLVSSVSNGAVLQEQQEDVHFGGAPAVVPRGFLLLPAWNVSPGVLLRAETARQGKSLSSHAAVGVRGCVGKVLRGRDTGVYLLIAFASVLG